MLIIVNSNYFYFLKLNFKFIIYYVSNELEGSTIMAKKNSKNNDFLNLNREYSSPKIYELLLELVNDDREDLAKIVLKVDYLLEYTSNAIKHRDYEEAKEALIKSRERIDTLKQEGVKVDYLEYLYEGISKKCKM